MHEVFFAAHHAHGKATAQGLAVDHVVRGDVVELLGTPRRHPETRVDFIKDEGNVEGCRGGAELMQPVGVVGNAVVGLADLAMRKTELWKGRILLRQLIKREERQSSIIRKKCNDLVMRPAYRILLPFFCCLPSLSH